MKVKKLYGLEKHLSNLIELFDNNKLPKVLMLTGKKGQGKFTLVNHLMSYIFDKKNYSLKDNSILNENKLQNIKENSNVNIVYFNCIQKNVKIEENLKGIPGITRVTSTSRENTGTVLIETDPDYDIDAMLFEIKNAVDKVPSFPISLEPVVVTKIEEQQPTVIFSLSGAEIDLK